ncbi:MAG: Pyruvate carboxylase subunit B [Candidatus Methanofastidiosum methylothiophilum]|jgi:biotin carboxyl carrier protein|uniref:Pyruvate carboxylase subunit B n=1 Tax=Candidatus Methanofastidiosum methylothiophilum TaxID=1705564 RepID=A0A150JGQ2_9EURY|nr:MAG: Pyruvate carboxylase subunit B [Candidatus Methanofastidiosum methylthiophilus]HNV94384.1 acetyl-CoA carboxylase biotin carboxyl carrier protein subunit [Methanofastidiosum sp.]KYC55703.1 MAG: Pyruvate carboxylase subunit B [Candidatus Methanofastidiosum methylthiophilus]KYC56400.1 MAG: Pyruvate carboxylase subunit B [Candidatus Methanofastidiosum methylthiophilus]HOT85158.1 acetyl-CoA carboxylase biotin carboxyl carrier protein subunit [Methanofastidiosum sp.]
MTDSILRSPLPGIIQSIIVKEGQIIKRGDAVVLISVMKMESPVVANANGRIKRLLIKELDEISYGEALLIIEER